MVLKIYGMLWALIAVTALLLLATGNFTLLTLVAFGFVSFGMIFMGMMGVLPTSMSHHGGTAEPLVKVRNAAKQEAAVFHHNNLATR